MKRLQKIARKGDWKESGSTHAWVGAYAVHDGTLDSQTMARFDSISSAYSMRISAPLGMFYLHLRSSVAEFFAALRTGLSSIDWASTSQDPLLSPSASAAAAAEAERGRWIIAQIQAREEEFTTAEEVKIWCGTFNVNDKLPSGSLEDWVAGSEGAELLVFGCVLTSSFFFAVVDAPHQISRIRSLDGSDGAILLSARRSLARSPREIPRPTRRALREGPSPLPSQTDTNLPQLHSRQLVGALIIIYVLKSSAQHISSVSSNSVATGILGLIANKGATAIRLRSVSPSSSLVASDASHSYKDSYLTFVNSHLAAFTQMTEKRNQEVRDIGRAMAFPVQEAGRDPWTPNLRPKVERTEESLGVFDSQ